MRLNPGVVRAVTACGAGERLISAWHALAFYTNAAPEQTLIQSVSATRNVKGRRVEVQVRSTAAVQGVRAVVQVGAVCGGGS